MSATSFHTGAGGSGAEGSGDPAGADDANGPGLPSVSVVIAAFDVAELLPEALDSVLAQEGVDLEVVVVDDGSTDTTGEIADAYAARDPRVVVVHQGNGGLGAARNAGIARSSGELLTFCDADDVVPPGAYAAMARSLAASGSDFVIGRTERSDSQDRWQPVWIDEVHDGAPYRGLRIAERPVAIKNILECNRMYRRASWDRIGPFPVGGLSEGYVPMVRSFLEGRTFDVLDEVTYDWRVRDDGTSSTQQKSRTPSLRDRLAALEVARGHVEAEDCPAVRSAWVARALELDLSGYYRFAAEASDEFRALLTTAARDLLQRADDDALRLVSVHRKLSAWFAAQERWDAVTWLEDNVAQLRQHGSLLAGWPTADASALAHLELDPPARLLGLSVYDTRARTALQEVRLTGDGVEIGAELWLRGVKRPTALDEAWLELSLPDRPTLRLDTRHEGRRIRARVDAAALREWAGGALGRVAVAARYTWGDASGAVGLRPPGEKLPVARPIRSAEVRAELDDDGVLALRLVPPPVQTRSLRISRRGGVAHLTGTHGPRRVRVPLPAADGQTHVPRVRAGTRRAALAWPRTETTGVIVPRGLGARRLPWRWEATVRGEAALVPRGPLVELDSIKAEHDRLVLTLQVRDRWGLDLDAVRWFPGTARAHRSTVTLVLTRDDLRPFRSPTRLTATATEPLAPVTVRLARNLLAAGPLDLPLGEHVVRVRSNTRGEVVLVARRPGERRRRPRQG